MEIKGKVHCFFEQSGTFKNEFIKLGIPAEDYDIQNNFGETDHVIDLFGEISTAYGGGQDTIFQQITKDDLIMAFFPCIFFNQQNTTFFDGTNRNWIGCGRRQIADFILQRADQRNEFYKLLLKLCNYCETNNLKLIVENPYSVLHYLHNNFLYKPTIIDKNGQLRGDYFVKPTQYIFINCKPTFGKSYSIPKEKKRVNLCGGHNGSLCDEERSMISPDYARNFICDFILGKTQNQKGMQLSLF